MYKSFVIVSRSLHIEALRNTFVHRGEISIGDIIEFYRQYEKEIKRSTIDWRIYELQQKGILHRITRGVYSLNEPERNHYVPEIGRALKQLYNRVHRQFPFIELCIWSTRWLNEFMLHQPGKFYIILETEKEVAETVFYFLSEAGEDVYLNPSEEILKKYAINKAEPVVITYLTTEAPTQRVGDIRTVTLEKVLVDLYCDKVLFAAQQGNELQYIYHTAFDEYLINEAGMLRYASRRNKRTEIERLINEHLRNGNK